MNFSFELSWALITGSVDQSAMAGISTALWAVFGWLVMIRTVIAFGVMALMIVSRWKVFKKAWLPGRGIFVPFYNIYLMFKLGGRSGRNVLWILIPPVLGVLMIINYFKIARRFWKHPAYGLGIRFLRFIFIPILAFDDSKYLGKKAVAKSVAKTPAKKVIKKKTPAKKVKLLKKK